MFVNTQDVFGMSPNDFVISPDTIYIREIREPKTPKIDRFANTIFGGAIFTVKAAVVLTAVTALAPIVLTAAVVGAPFVIIGTLIVATLVAKAAATVLSAAVVLGVLAVLVTAKIIKTAAFFIVFAAITSVILGESQNDRFVLENQRVVVSKPRIERKITRQTPDVSEVAKVAVDTFAFTAISIIAASVVIKLAPVALQYGSDLVTEWMAPVTANVLLSGL